MVNKPKGQSEVCKIILDNHYDWCKKEGRDTSWYKDWRKTYVETSKLLRKNKKRKSLDK